MKKPYIFIIFYVFVILSPTVFAAQVTQVFSGQEGLEIRYPIIEIGKLNTQYYPHFHVFNLSNGYNYRNGDDINCTLHIYRPDGSHAYKNYSTHFDDIFDIEFNLSSTLFNQVGQWSYIVQCEETNLGIGGFSSSSIYINQTGFEDRTSLLSIVLVYMLLIVFYGFFSVHSYNRADADTNRADYWISFLCLALATMMLLVCFGVVWAYTDGGNVNTLLDVTFIVNSIIIFFGGLVYMYRQVISMMSFKNSERKWDKGKWL